MSNKSNFLFLNYRWRRLGIFLVSWVCIEIAEFFANDPYHNDEGSWAGLVLGIITLPFGVLIYWWCDKRIVPLSNSNSMQTILLIILSTIAINESLSLIEALMIRAH